MIAVILAAGFGSRLRPRTDGTPKTIRTRLAALDGCHPYPSGGNFIMCRLADGGPSASVLARRMLEASRIECLIVRRAAGASLDPPHLYYPRTFFEAFGRAHDRRACITPQVPDYANSAFRYNVLLEP